MRFPAVALFSFTQSLQASQASLPELPTPVSWTRPPILRNLPRHHAETKPLKGNKDGQHADSRYPQKEQFEGNCLRRVEPCRAAEELSYTDASRCAPLTHSTSFSIAWRICAHELQFFDTERRSCGQRSRYTALQVRVSNVHGAHTVEIQFDPSCCREGQKPLLSAGRCSPTVSVDGKPCAT